MNVLKNIKRRLLDGKRLDESVRPSTDELTEVGSDRLEEVAGGGAVTDDRHLYPNALVPHDPY